MTASNREEVAKRLALLAPPLEYERVGYKEWAVEFALGHPSTHEFEAARPTRFNRLVSNVCGGDVCVSVKRGSENLFIGPVELSCYAAERSVKLAARYDLTVMLPTFNTGTKIVLDVLFWSDVKLRELLRGPFFRGRQLFVLGKKLEGRGHKVQVIFSGIEADPR